MIDADKPDMNLRREFCVVLGVWLKYLCVIEAAELLVWTLKSPELLMKDKRLTGGALTADLKFSLVTQCFTACQATVGCHSFNYQATLGNCELNHKSGDKDPHLLKDSEGFDYYTRLSWLLNEEENRTLYASCKGSNVTGSRHVNALTPWTPWTNCNTKCGFGYRRRHRECRDEEGETGAACPGVTEEWMGCEADECPESYPGTWRPWGDWGECSTSRTCGEGISERMRECNITSPAGMCGQHGRETNICGNPPCDEPVTLLGGETSADGIVHVYGSKTGGFGKICGDGWSIGEADIACVQMGFLEAQRIVTNTSVFEDSGHPYALSGLSCSGTHRHLQDCAHDPWDAPSDCSMPAAIVCSLNGDWGAWGVWSVCSSTCSDGYRARSRACDSPPPMYGGLECEGERVDKDHHSCSPNNITCTVDGYYNDWSPWGDCSLSCAGGIQGRSRDCVPPIHGGEDCEGPPDDSQPCNEHHCPVDGEWSEWADWTGCEMPGDEACGDGELSRTRTCTPPMHGGEECAGADREAEDCFITCEVPGEWLEWTEWTDCSVTCEGGSRIRARDCNMTSYGENTIPCIGDSMLEEDCNMFTCDQTQFKKSCEGWKELGMVGVKHQKVEILIYDYLEPLKVYCDMEIMDGKGVTVIKHHQMERTHVTGKESSFQVPVEYDINNMMDIEMMKEVMQHCRQYISWECRSAIINNNNKEGVVNTFWNDLDETPRYYFGGASAVAEEEDRIGMMCACGLDDTCVNETLACNCDANDNALRQDAGYLTYKDHLPVSSMIFGDTGTIGEEEGYYTLGPLECYGEVDEPAK